MLCDILSWLSRAISPFYSSRGSFPSSRQRLKNPLSTVSLSRVEIAWISLLRVIRFRLSLGASQSVVEKMPQAFANLFKRSTGISSNRCFKSGHPSSSFICLWKSKPIAKYYNGFLLKSKLATTERRYQGLHTWYVGAIARQFINRWLN